MGWYLLVYILARRYPCFCLRQSGLRFVSTIAHFTRYRMATTFAVNDGVNSWTQPVKPVVLPRCEWGCVRVTDINLLSDWAGIRFVSKRCWIRVCIQDFPIAMGLGRVSFVTASEKLIHTANQQRLEELLFGDRTRILPYLNSATALNEAVVAQRSFSEKSQISSPPSAPPSNPNPRYR